MSRLLGLAAIVVATLVAPASSALAQRPAKQQAVTPLPEWATISRQCTTTARKPPSEKALRIAEIAKDEFYYFGGHRIDGNGRLFSFGVVESEQEENEENIETYRLGHLGWWHVLRYWRLLAEAKLPVDAAREHLRLRGIPGAAAAPDDKDIDKPSRLGIARALEAIDRIPQSLTLSAAEKDIIKQALIRAAINDVAWSAAFISAVMRQAGLTDKEFEFSEAHNIYIDQALQVVLGEAAGAQPAGFYRACPPGSTRPRPGDLVCYHRHTRQYASRQPVEIRNMMLADSIAKPAVDRIHKSHCDVVVHVDAKAARVYVVGGNVQQAVTVKKLVLDRRRGTLVEVQPGNCRLDGRWTFPPPTAGKPVAPQLSSECSLNRKPWFVLLQARG
jgi:hypothetical protein